jgi:hypothetical protein
VILAGVGLTGGELRLLGILVLAIALVALFASPPR